MASVNASPVHECFLQTEIEQKNHTINTTKEGKKRPAALKIFPGSIVVSAESSKPVDSLTMVFQFLLNFITITSNLFVQSPDSVGHLKSQGITHILNVSAVPFSDKFVDKVNEELEPTETTATKHKIKLLHVYNLDLNTNDITKNLPMIFQFIDSAKETNGKILVHCQAGISRSVSVVMAYIIWNHYNDIKSIYDVLTMVRTIRTIADPITGFCIQLEIFLQVKKDNPDDTLEDVCKQTCIQYNKPCQN